MARSQASSSCSQEKKACVKWVEKYFNDCVCSLSSGISFGVGFVSLACWGVAEIPQIITNFQTKSGHGVSLALLLTWVLGDIFNLVGCLLEPATLPTQFYTALLYTSTTAVLLLQTIYYDYWLGCWKRRRFSDNSHVEDSEENQDSKLSEQSRPIPTTPLRRSSPLVDLYYTSARSLARSSTPPYGSSYLAVPRSGPPATLRDDSSSEDQEESAEPTRRSRRPPRQTRARPNNRVVSRSVGYGTFIASSVGLPFQAKGMLEAQLVLYGRRLLQETRVDEVEENPYGLVLGWIMAAIYMGGRLPQIYLNIKRASVEGLNPLMFMFALIANATYVGSILVRSIEWDRIKANAPWLLDAVVCVLLDLFIMIQFAYYKFMQRRAAHQEDDCESYADVKKPLI